MSKVSRPTLSQVFIASFTALVILLAALLYLVQESSRNTILESSERLRDEGSKQIAASVSGYLAQAEKAMAYLEAQISEGILDPADTNSLESTLFSVLLSAPDLSEVTLTRAQRSGFDDEGEVMLANSGRSQLSLLREHDATGEHVDTHFIHSDGPSFTSELRTRLHGMGTALPPFKRESLSDVQDPTEQLSFRTPASKEFDGQLLWSDLHWVDSDVELPESERRVRVSVQKTIKDRNGTFIGVARIGLLTEQIDKISRLKMIESNHSDPHRVFLTDNQGRLITRSSPDDALKSFDGDLRVVATHLPPAVEAALELPALGTISNEQPRWSGRVRAHDEDFLVTFRALGNTQDWIVGIVMPESFYLGTLVEIRNRLLVAALVIMVCIIFGGSLIVRSVRSAQRHMMQETSKMNRFDFSPAQYQTPFSDVNDSLDNLERAKTAMRAMGKYVPIDLIRRLYQEKSEPILGGEETEISMMFTDIKDFTSHSEKMPPNDLANALGLYLQAMVRVIQHETSGTIDKFIGDAVMALWNAPAKLNDHSQRACRAALGCLRATRELFASTRWQGLPPFHTRFGLHRAEVLVGHFGAPDRMNFTAIGDGVNLASRLEGLNKFYGTSIIVSHPIYESAKDHFDFRALDLVAVKGKSEGVMIYELVAEKGRADEETRGTISNYERAFEAYRRKEFATAESILKNQISDAPSKALLERCRELIEHPPKDPWTGIYALSQK